MGKLYMIINPHLSCAEWTWGNPGGTFECGGDLAETHSNVTFSLKSFNTAREASEKKSKLGVLHSCCLSSTPAYFFCRQFPVSLVMRKAAWLTADPHLSLSSSNSNCSLFPRHTLLQLPSPDSSCYPSSHLQQAFSGKLPAKHDREASRPAK